MLLLLLLLLLLSVGKLVNHIFVKLFFADVSWKRQSALNSGSYPHPDSGSGPDWPWQRSVDELFLFHVQVSLLFVLTRSRHL